MDGYLEESKSELHELINKIDDFTVIMRLLAIIKNCSSVNNKEKNKAISL